MNEIKLTYIMSTLNKLPYLKKTMATLLENTEKDEEIMVADGGSTDGTKEFLEKLYKQGEIKYFVSKKDAGESHALNKLFFKANGDLIRIITDDDVSHYSSIQKCKSFMLTHPEIDLLGTNGGFRNQLPENNVRPLSYQDEYKQWQKNHTPFSSCGLGLMFRKSSLPLTGLWNPSFKRADAEFMMRVSFGAANIAWYNAPTFVNISNPQSTSITFMKKIEDETDRLNKFYLNKNPNLYITKKIKILRNKIRGKIFYRESPSDGKRLAEEPMAQWLKIFAASEKWLEETNKFTDSKFVWNK